MPSNLFSDIGKSEPKDTWNFCSVSVSFVRDNSGNSPWPHVSQSSLGNTPKEPGGFMAVLCGSRSCRGRQRCPTAFCIALQLRLPGQPTVQGKGFRLGSLSSWLQLLKHSRCQSSVWVCSSLAIHHFFQGSWRRYRWAGSADPRTHQGFHYTRNSAISLLYTSGAMEIALIEAIN